MDRNKLLIGILAVLFLIAGYVNYNFFFKSAPPKKTVVPPPEGVKKGSAPKPVPAARGVQPIPAAETPLVSLVKFEPIPVDDSSLKDQLKKGLWGREPFLTPEELRPPEPEEKKVERIDIPVTVNSILISEGQRVAIVNGELRSVGEFVGTTGERVAAITKDGVLLEKAGLKRMVPMGSNTIEVKSREK